MIDNSCGCSEQSHYSLRLVIRLNVFDCYGRGDFGTDFLVATACRFLPVRRRVLAVPLALTWWR